MKYPQHYRPNPVTAGLTYRFAIVASVLMLVHVTLEGGLSLPTLIRVTGPAIAVIAIVAAGCIAGARLASDRFVILGPRARTQEGSS